MYPFLAELAHPTIQPRLELGAPQRFSFVEEVKAIRSFHGNAEPVLLRKIFQLRYEVYCRERAYLSADGFDKELEIDEYELCSTHFAAHTHDDFVVGTVRLVQPARSQPYPFEKHCSVFDNHGFPAREQTVEISRLIVRKPYRRRRGNSLQGISKEFLDNANPAAIPLACGSDNPMLLLGIYREMYRHSRQAGIRFWYAAMERSLARSLEKMGFRFTPIGPQTDYYGAVTPYMVDIHELETTLRRDNSVLAAWFID